MLTKAVRLIYSRRGWFKRFILIRRPIRLNLPHFKMYVRLDDWAIGARIAVKRSYEAHVTTVMQSVLKPGMVVVDVGANIGYYSLFAAAHVGATGKVLAFEPSQQNCDLLRLSVAANHFNNIVIHQCAVTDVDGIVGFSMDDSNGVINATNPAAATYQVQAVKLDTTLANEPRIDMIKIDVEGAEGRVFRGMTDILARHRPIIFSEFSPNGLRKTSEVTPQEYIQNLENAGYKLHVIDRVQGVAALPQTYDEIMAHFSHTPSDHLDLVAYPQ